LKVNDLLDGTDTVLDDVDDVEDAFVAVELVVL
jgi:hypothetical protein